MIKLILFFIIIATANVYASDTQSEDKFLATNPKIFQLQTELRAHRFSCKELINSYLNRIRLYNLTLIDNKAPLNAITQINPQALSDAEKLDSEIANNKFSKNLFCIPVIVKDNIDVQGLRTSSGSLSLLGTYPLADAEIISSIKRQGGIILAKSSMNELAEGIDGISSLSGRIGNAYNTSYTSGGSSGGSAVSVAAGFAPLAIGSDNSGSIRIPAAYNGIYGLRPTYGLIKTSGVFPLGNLDGTVGPMANNVSDLALLLTAMANNKTNYAQNLNAKSLALRRFAIVKSVAGKSLWDGMPKPIADIYAKTIINLQKQGAIISEIDLPKYNLDRKNNMAGTGDEINDYLIHNISSIGKFKDVCLGNSRVFGTPKHCLEFVVGIKAKNSHEYNLVKQIIAKNQSYIQGIMQNKHLDGLILPIVKSGVASNDWHQLENAVVISSNSGLPEITLPIAQYDGLPVGLEILGQKYTESALLNYAFAYQENYYSFKAPKLVMDAEFNNWSIDQLNILYPLLGKISFDTVIKLTNHNEINAAQAISATQKAITLITAYRTYHPNK